MQSTKIVCFASPHSTKAILEMTPEEAQAWAASWKVVNEAEIAELRATPNDVKLQQVAALMRSPYFERERETRAEDEAATRLAWKKLRAAYGIA